MLKKILPVLLFPVAAYAQQDDPIDDFDRRLTALEKKVNNHTLYNAPARSEVIEGYNLFFTGDLLYWRAEENGLTYAFKVKDPAEVPVNVHLHLKDPHSRWEPGYRVGFGVNIPHDHWDLYFVWTHLNSRAHGHTRAKSDEGIFPVWAIPFGPLGISYVKAARAHWKLYLNVVDAELGKEYYVGSKLSLRPHLDLRTVFIDQHYDISYFKGPLDDHIEMKLNYWGIGPRVGLDMQWWLVCGFSLMGNADISLVYGNDSLHQKEKLKDMPGPIVLRDHLHITRAITDLGIYLGWDQMLDHDKYHIGFKAGWEQHIFFEQNQFIRFLDPVFEGSLVSNQGDLCMQGWTISGRVDF